MENLYSFVGKALVWGITGLIVLFAAMLIFLFIREQWRNLCVRTGINESVHYFRGKSFDTHLLREAYKYPFWGRMHKRWVLRFRLRNIKAATRKQLYDKRCVFCNQQFTYSDSDIIREGVHLSVQCPHCRILNLAPNPVFIKGGLI